VVMDDGDRPILPNSCNVLCVACAYGHINIVSFLLSLKKTIHLTSQVEPGELDAVIFQKVIDPLDYA